jgi:hypothetical protein
MKKIFLWASLCLFAFFAQAQEQEESSIPATEITRRFTGGFTGGFNATQIDGDGLIGFNKLGWYGGVVANAIFTESKYLGIGITFSQRGSSSAIFSKGGKVKFNMLEVPLMFHFCDWKSEAGFYRVHAGVGACYSRLINVNAINTAYHDFEDSFKTDNVSWILETMFYQNKHFGFGLRFSKSFNKIYTQPNPSAPNANFVERWLTIRTVYLF